MSRSKFILVGVVLPISYQLYGMRGQQEHKCAAESSVPQRSERDAFAELNALKAQAEGIKIKLLFDVIQQNQADAPVFVKELLALGMSHENAVNKDGDTPFMAAIKVGNPQVMRLLLGSKTNLAHKNHAGKTARQLALENKQFDIVKSIDKLYDQRGILLVRGIKDDVDIDKIKAVLAAGAHVDVQDKQFEQTPLMVAAEMGDEPAAHLLLKWGASVNKRDIFGRTALMWAAEKGYSSIVELLLNAGADATFKNVSGRTARDVAQGANTQVYNEIVSMLAVAEKKQDQNLPAEEK